jgi:hypothetical protein
MEPNWALGARTKIGTMPTANRTELRGEGINSVKDLNKPRHSSTNCACFRFFSTGDIGSETSTLSESFDRQFILGFFHQIMPNS